GGAQRKYGCKRGEQGAPSRLSRSRHRQGHSNRTSADRVDGTVTQEGRCAAPRVESSAGVAGLPGPKLGAVGLPPHVQTSSIPSFATEATAGVPGSGAAGHFVTQGGPARSEAKGRVR